MFKFPHTDGVRVHVRLKVKPDFLNLNLNLNQRLIKKFFERTFHYRIDAIDNEKISDEVKHGQSGLILKFPYFFF